MPSFAHMATFISLLESPAIDVHQSRCALVRNRNADCLRCAQACTSGCIRFDGETGELSVSPERCIGCGTCATACPTGALEAVAVRDINLLGQCQEASEKTPGICIACAQLLDRAGDKVDSSKLVRVECLGRIDESLLMALIARCGKPVILAHGECASCEHAPGRAMTSQVVATTKGLLSAWGHTDCVKVSDRLPSWTRAEKPGYSQSRRAFFQQAESEGKRFGSAALQVAISEASGKQTSDTRATQPALKIGKDGSLPHALPERRKRLLGALKSLGEPQDVMIDTRLWGNVIIDAEKCSSCRMCATFCPTGALKKFENAGGIFGVEHVPAACVKCRSCESICPEKALSISEEVFAVDLLQSVTERFEMKPPEVRRGTSHSIRDSLKPLMKIDRVYER